MRVCIGCATNVDNLDTGRTNVLRGDLPMQGPLEGLSMDAPPPQSSVVHWRIRMDTS